VASSKLHIKYASTYNYSAYARTEPTFNHYYNMLREEVDANQEINWLSEVPQENWILAWDGG